MLGQDWRGAQVDPGSVAATELEDLVAAVWAINGIRRSLAHMSHAWSARLQHPAAAAATLSMSRASSYEELASSAAGGNGHMRNVSTDLLSRASAEEKVGGPQDAARTFASGHFLASNRSAPSPGPPSSLQGTEQPEAPNADESPAEDVAADARSDTSQGAAEAATDEQLTSGQLTPTRQASGTPVTAFPK